MVGRLKKGFFSPETNKKSTTIGRFDFKKVQAFPLELESQEILFIQVIRKIFKK